MRGIRGYRKTALAAACATLLLGLGVTAADYPPWWTDRGVVIDGAQPSDYAAANLGQLKCFAARARDELDENLSGGAGTTLGEFVAGFSLSGNYVAINLGQLKNVASKVYDRLIEEGYTNAYPWTETTDDDNDFAACNLGQLKNVFSFDLTADSDEDDMYDWIERRIVDADQNDDIQTLGDVLPDDDFDQDGYANVYEARGNGDPVDHATVPTAARFVSPLGLHVPPFDSWDNASRTIMAALAATAPYDVVLVADGVYSLATGYEGTGMGGIVFPEHPVALRSLNGPENCILDAAKIGRVITFEPWCPEIRTKQLVGFTVRNGDHYMDEGGGGILCDGCSPVIENCIIRYNIAREWGGGGGIRCVNGAAPLIRGCTIEDNHAMYFGGGGGVAVGGAPAGCVEIQQCLFDGNCADGDGGGLIAGGGGQLALLDCTFVGNEADKGGGVALYGCAGSVRDCTITLNQGEDEGGGVSCYSCDITFSGCMIAQNEMVGINGAGGGLYVGSCHSVTLENCAIVENGATGTGSYPGYGGGVYNRLCDDLRILHCTIANNTAGRTSSAGIDLRKASDNDACLIQNSIVWGNLSAGQPAQIVNLDVDLDLTVEWCDVEGGWEGGTQILDQEPKLTAQTYRLKADSPCINAGTESEPAGDMDCEQRGSTPDLGWDEYIDDDQDGMADGWEIRHFGSTATHDSSSGDSDGDSSTNIEEYDNGTDPSSDLGTDTDGDGLSDDWELVERPSANPPKEATDPTKWDSDEDGLSDALDPQPNNYADTDGDGLSDDWEIYYFEGLGTDATVDSDGDGLNNGQEVANRTNPAAQDTDGDGLFDGWEVDKGLDPTDPSGDNGSQGDIDADGLSNADEQSLYGTDPTNWDTDGDMMDDGWEVAYGFDPNNAASPGGNPTDDADGDGLSNFDEMRWGADPNDTDTDNDWTTDGEEASAGSDPCDADDEGNPDRCTQVNLKVGDDSNSNSERYALIVGHVRHVATQFGEVESKTYNFVRGKSHSFNVRWIASSRATPDYDYLARIANMPEAGSWSVEWQEGNGVVIHDRQYILGKHRESDFDYSAGKIGTLYLVDPDLDVDLDGDGSFTEDDPEETASPGICVCLNNDDDGAPNGADNGNDQIDTTDDKDDMAVLKLRKLYPSYVSSGTVTLSVSDQGKLRIFDNNDTARIGPSPGPDADSYEVPLSDIIAGDLDFLLEGVAPGEVTVALIYEDDSGDECCRDEVLVTVLSADLDAKVPNRHRCGFSVVADEDEMTSGAAIRTTEGGQTTLVVEDPGVASGVLRLAWQDPDPARRLLIGGATSATFQDIACAGATWPQTYSVQIDGEWLATDSVVVSLEYEGNGQSLVADEVLLVADTSERKGEEADGRTEDTDTEEPINVANGANMIEKTDIFISCPVGPSLMLRRYYNTRRDHSDGLFGAGWSSTYEQKLLRIPGAVYDGVFANWRVFCLPEGQRLWFRELASGGFDPAPGNELTLQQDGAGYKVTTPWAIVHRFNADGSLKSVTDGFGNSLSLTYDAEARLEQVTHGSGPYLTFSYDAASGRMTGIGTHVPDLAMTYTYHENGTVASATRVTSSGNYVDEYTYDPVSGCMNWRKNAAGQTFDYACEAHEKDGETIYRATSLKMLPDWYEHTVAYSVGGDDKKRQVTYNRAGVPRVLTYEMQEADRFELKKLLGPNGDHGVEYTRNPVGDPLQQTIFDNGAPEDHDSILIDRTFDDKHNVLTETMKYDAGGGETWTYTWHQDLQTLTSVTDPLGHKTEYEYSPAGALTKVKLWNGGISYDTTIAYGAGGRPVRIENANGNKVILAYDADGYLDTVTPDAGPAVGCDFNSLGHLVSITMPGAGGDRTTTFEPDELGRVGKITYPDEGTELFEYDKLGNLTKYTDRADRVVDLTYLPGGNPGSVTRYLDGQPVSIEATYDNQLNVLSIEDELGRLVEQYSLDMQDRVEQVTNIEDQQMNVTYGVGDYVVSIQRFDGSTVACDYDGAGRLSSLEYPGDNTLTFTYLANGLPDTSANAIGTVDNDYNGANRLTSSKSVAPFNSGQVAYQYYDAGQIKKISGAFGDKDYSYDAGERITTLADTHSGSFGFTYNPYNGFVAGVSHATVPLSVEYQYDTLDRVTGIVWRGPGDAVVCSQSYTLNDVGMITEVQYEDGSRTTYVYDDLDRLCEEKQYDSGDVLIKTLAWTYDLAGNRATATEDGQETAYTLAEDNNRLVAWGTSGAATYDDAGNTVTLTHDGSDTLSLDWSSQYQLNSVSSGGQSIEAYTYDALGRRATIESGGETRSLVYDGMHVVAEVDPAGGLLTSYTHGPGIDNLFSMTDHSGASPVTYYYLTDHLGTVHAVTDESGSIVESYRFDAWGRVLGVYDGNGTPLEESAIGNHYLWQGRWYSWETGLYYFRARWYDPVTGRWLSKDPIGISGGLNQYVFCYNNPVNLADPLGDKPGFFERRKLKRMTQEEKEAYVRSKAQAIVIKHKNVIKRDILLRQLQEHYTDVTGARGIIEGFKSRSLDGWTTSAVDSHVGTHGLKPSKGYQDAKRRQGNGKGKGKGEADNQNDWLKDYKRDDCDKDKSPKDPNAWLKPYEE